jgi:phosphate transport system ATP-binding protein
MAGFARQEGWVVGLPDGQAPPTARFTTAAPWLEPTRTPAAGSDGGARPDAPAISVSQYPDHQPPVGQHPGDNGAGGRLPDVGPLMDLETRDLAAWFGSHKVLEGVSLKMEAGAVTALIGPSGCGKSTFLRILNRMHELVRSAALAGEVLLGGEDIYDPRQRAADVRRRIGMVFQKPNPFPAMSIYENVASGLKLAGIKVRNRDEVVQTSLQRAGLWNEVRKRLRTPGGALSGGQQQRLCIARSLAVAPEVLLMDEPCSALDPTSTRRIEETIRELAGQVTIVIVTHNMQQAQRVSANCAFFLASENTPGHIVESGPTEQLFENPVDPRTAAYVHGQFG